MTDFRHEIPMRWADLDSLNHVNNVVYLAYAANARAVLEGLPADPIRTMHVQFKRPLLLGRKPVVVTSRIEEHGLAQSVGIDGSDAEFATVESQFGDLAPGPEPREDVHVADLAVRHSDLGSGDTVTEAQVFELFQETRVPFIDQVLDRATPGNFVLAQVTAHFHRPIAWRPEPLQARSWVSRVGNASFTIEAQLTDGDGVLARSTAILVGFDASTQRSRPFTDREKATLTARVSPAS